MCKLQRKPDFILKAMDKLTNEKSRIGAAWKEDDGSIAIILDRFISISGAEKLTIRLFPNDFKE